MIGGGSAAGQCGAKFQRPFASNEISPATPSRRKSPAARDKIPRHFQPAHATNLMLEQHRVWGHKRYMAWGKRAGLVGLFLFGCHAIASADPAEYHGGSNYAFYRLDGCIRQKYGVVHQYDQAHEIIDAQLVTMRANGQHRLRIPIYFRHGVDSEDSMDSSGGDFALKYKANLSNLLMAVKHAGFQEVEISFHPLANNFPWKWLEWNEALYQEHLNLIINLRKILVASHLKYRIDLLNEAVPTPDQKMLLRYDRRLWSDYTKKFGKSDTIGFSIIPAPGRLRELPDVYGGNPPNVFDLHPYKDANKVLLEARSILKQQGFGHIPWIIGESFYDDSLEAEEIADMIRQTGQRILFLLQWPLTRERHCADVDSVPLKFDQYHQRGF